MSEIVPIGIALTLRSPFLFQGLANAMLGIDAAQLRDEHGRPIIPADQVKGVLRAACDVLAKRAPDLAPGPFIAKLFGRPSPDGSFDEPDRALLIFGDLAADLAKDLERTATRIEIDDELGSVKSGALQVAELVAPFGMEAEFSGECVLLAEPGIDVAKTVTLLSRAAGLVPAVGAFKSAGFGEVVKRDVHIEARKRRRVSLAPPKPSEVQGGRQQPERIAYRVTFDRPVLVDAERVTDNLFVGSNVVPGAAFKGALAGMLKLAGADPECDQRWERALSSLRISHAFPENDDEALSGFRLPASLYAWEDEGKIEFADALLQGLESPEEITGLVVEANGGPAAPLHPVDWKEKYFAAFSQQHRFPASAELTPQPRTHVKIEAETLVAAEQQLFTTVAQGVLRKD